MAQYWWGDDETQRRMHWLAWWKMYIPKEKGGMGFRDLCSFNKALLAKQVWRLIGNNDSLCAKILRAKYYPDGNILSAKLKKGSSYVWQSICSGIETFNQGRIWRIGNRLTVNIWDDPWIPTSSSPGRS